MGSNNITDEYIAKVEKNRKLRTDLFEKLRDCHNKLIIRNESIKSIIQYTAIYAAFSAINIGLFALEINSVALIILSGLTVGYGLVVFNDVVTVIKNKPDEIYKSIAEYNRELSDLDNKYMDYSNEIEKQNKLNSKNVLYFDVNEKEIIKDNGKKEQELTFSHVENDTKIINDNAKKEQKITFSHVENEKTKVKKYTKK